MSDRKKFGWPSIVALLIGLPVLYVLSSGPTRSLAFGVRVAHLSVTSSGDEIGGPVSIDRGPWWPVVYAPLQWASEQRWGEPLNHYWGMFPIRAIQAST